MTLQDNITNLIPCKLFNECHTKCYIKDGKFSLDNNIYQQEACRIQLDMLAQPTLIKQQEKLWDFINYITPLIKSIIKSNAKSFGYLDLEDLTGFFQLMFYERWNKQLIKKTYSLRQGVHGYLIYCIKNELIGLKNKQKEENEVWSYEIWSSKYESAFNIEET